MGGPEDLLHIRLEVHEFKPELSAMLARKPIMPNSWQDIEDAFDQAAALEGDARRGFLDSLAEPGIRAEVESLLAAEAARMRCSKIW